MFGWSKCEKEKKNVKKEKRNTQGEENKGSGKKKMFYFLL